MRISNLVLIATWCGLAGCQVGSPSDELEQEQLAIVEGQWAPGDDAVVALTQGGFTFCTGTLITPNYVATAAHCLPPSANIPVDAMRVTVGLHVWSGTSYRVRRVLAHPLWTNTAVLDDIGIIELLDPITDIEPMPYQIELSDDDVGKPVRILGYGLTGRDEGDTGTRRQGASILERVNVDTIRYSDVGSLTCNGDSGGPLFLERDGVEYLVGIHARSNCVNSSIDTRVDVHIANFLAPFMAGSDCGFNNICATDCDAADPDCTCETDGFCTTQCEDPDDDADCPANCNPDGVCQPDGCATADLDCCALDDGICLQGCALEDDPDCLAEECSADDRCNLACPADADPDCGSVGCRAGNQSAWVMLLLAGVLLLAGRKRHA